MRSAVRERGRSGSGAVRARRWTRVWYAVVAVIALLAAGGYGWYRLELRPVAASGAGRQFVVQEGQNGPKIATALKAAGLIRDRDAFITYVNFHGLRAELKAGVYLLSPAQSAPMIAGALADGRVDVSRLVVPEGSRLRDIERLAAARGIRTVDFEAALATAHTESFLGSKPAGVSLEGYLFPDSYQVSPTTTASALVNTMLQTFGQQVGPAYGQAFAAEGLTLHQGLTLASIVEREVSSAADRPIVAQIFLKRLQLGMPLGSDVTVHYAADLRGVAFSTSLNSPYNTYLHAGLPPGPICSPGLAALDAVAHPAATDYLYFLAGKDGKTHYATTYAQHEQNIAKYLN